MYVVNRLCGLSDRSAVSLANTFLEGASIATLLIRCVQNSYTLVAAPFTARKSMMRQLMDEDRIDTHIITSEYPRTQAEARTLLGRVVADRAIGRFVFGIKDKDNV